MLSRSNTRAWRLIVMGLERECEWLLSARDGAVSALASNAKIVMVANYFWQTKDGEGLPFSRRGPIDASAISLNGQPATGWRIQLLRPHVSEAFILQPQPGRNLLSVGPCSWTIDVGGPPDHEPPRWVEAPTLSPASLGMT